jgi:cell fate (sporulation/competence/biofilm development) regulator YlbF (YheA/YmcA/DUF963 family)
MNELINIKDYFENTINSIRNEIGLLRDEFKNTFKVLNDANVLALSSLDKRFEYIEKATVKTDMAAEKRFESVNEFREQLREQQNTFVTKNEVNIRFDNIEKKIDSLEKYSNSSEGKNSGISLVWGIIIVVISFIISGLSIAVSIFNK